VSASLPALSVSIRPARPGDEHHLFRLIGELARFEKLEQRVTGSAASLAEHLFGERPVAEALVAELTSGEMVGFALCFTSYSTFLTRPGLYLEDLFVLEAHRKRGIGKALLDAVRELAVARGAGRLEWSVLDWNQDAIDFYRRAGASVLPDWRICRIEL
jgi:GNAT superfamily N-acetyltransferase